VSAWVLEIERPRKLEIGVGQGPKDVAELVFNYTVGSAGVQTSGNSKSRTSSLPISRVNARIGFCYQFCSHYVSFTEAKTERPAVISLCMANSKLTLCRCHFVLCLAHSSGVNLAACT
jgi:hypothetical protein